MLIDGVKMACEACIRGHRVSGCNHQDRKLLPIAKKGRPVSQCNHCRILRKSRAAHVKCDCGTKSSLKTGAHSHGADGNEIGTANATIIGNGVVSPTNGAAGCCAPPAGEGRPQAGVAKALPPINDSKSVPPPCSCCHGGQCTCALKKEPQLDAVPEFAEPTASSGFIPPEGRSKPRLPMTYSETSLTTFANGRHKPTHKHHISTHSGAPYSIPTVGHTGHAFAEHNGPTKASQPTARRTKSEHSSPNLRVYPGVPMPTAVISPFELTPMPATKSASTRSLARVPPDLTVDTHYPFEPYPSDFIQSANSDYAISISAGLYPQNSAAWGSFGHITGLDDGTTYNEPPDQGPFEFSSMLPPSLTSSTSGDERDDMAIYSGTSPTYAYGKEPNSQETIWPSEVPQQDIPVAVTPNEWNNGPSWDLYSVWDGYPDPSDLGQ